ncbi:LOB domain-containing protein 41, partial [Cucurbita argyrosperma subsp. argyrosperma]
MDAEFFAKAAVKAAPSGLVFNGSKPPNPKPTPPSSLPNSTAELASLISSMPAPIISALVFHHILLCFNYSVFIALFQLPKAVFCFLGVSAIFKSLLFEACGRIVNPIYGSAGLLWSGSWQLCQDAVEAVLKGAPILSVSSETAVSHMGPPLKGCDIRHVSKQQGAAPDSALRKIKTRRRFKRSAPNKPMPKEEPVVVNEFVFDDPTRVVSEPRCLKFELDSWVGHKSQEKDCSSGSSDEAECLSVEGSAVGQGGDVELELSLGL